MKLFKTYVEDLANLNNTTTKRNSYKYTPKDYTQMSGNDLANTVGIESEENIKKKRIKDLKLKKRA